MSSAEIDILINAAGGNIPQEQLSLMISRFLI